MRKMNNKGFAVSTMLFGLLIVIVLVLGTTMSIMAFNRKTSREFSEKIVDELENKKIISFKNGNYIKMTPTSTSYTITTAMTGYSKNQTINPSELNLWRVISINSDGTIDLVSEYASPYEVTFQGKTGYQNYIATLNQIASQYTNSKYTVGSRHMGYNDQTQTQTGTITDTSALDSTTAPWTTSTSDTTSASDEATGGGDMGYKRDEDLVKALGTLAANIAGTTTAADYWLASRYYTYDENFKIWRFQGRYFDNKNSEISALSFYYNSTIASKSKHVRPIITLKSGIEVNGGAGTENNPYILN